MFRRITLRFPLQRRLATTPDIPNAFIQTELHTPPDPAPVAPQKPSTIFNDNEPYMDTYQVFKELRNAGFSSDQSSQVINLVCAQLNHQMTRALEEYSHMYELENERYLFESAQQEIRVDITRSRENHIAESISSTNTLERDFRIISDELSNEFIQMKTDNQVVVAEQKSENTLSAKRIHLKIQETNHKITTELNSAMRSEIESLRWHLSRWGIMAILVSVFSGCTSFYVYKAKTEKRNTRNEFVPLVIYEPSELEEDDYHADLDKSVVG
ncbi:hypothetical protein DICA3_F18272 [Diutina catenulata]